MRDRRLNRAEAVEEYLVYQIRLYEYLHSFQMVLVDCSWNYYWLLCIASDTG